MLRIDGRRFIVRRCYENHLAGVLPALVEVGAIVARGETGMGVFESVADGEPVDAEAAFGVFAFDANAL